MVGALGMELWGPCPVQVEKFKKLWEQQRMVPMSFQHGVPGWSHETHYCRAEIHGGKPSAKSKLPVWSNKCSCWQPL